MFVEQGYTHEFKEDPLSFWPHGQSALEAFKKANPDQDEMQGMEAVLNAFFEESMQRTGIFTGRSGEEFSYTSINIPHLARAVIAKTDPFGTVPGQAEDTVARKHTRHFILPSSPALANGHQFTFVEIALMQAMKYLPSAVEDIRTGRVPEDREIYTLGAPTNKKWGKVTPEYLARLQEDPYTTLSQTYAQFATEHLPDSVGERARTSLLFQGHSMSSSLAAGAARELLIQGRATQDHALQSQDTPYAQVLMDAPVTLNPSRFRKEQIMVGYGLDSLYKLITSRETRRATFADISLPGKPSFIDLVASQLAKRGIGPNESKEEIARKKEGLSLIMQAMYEADHTIDASTTAVVIRRGTQDLALPPRKFRQRIKAKRGVHPNDTSLGRTLISGTDLAVTGDIRNAREFAVNGMHSFQLPFTSHLMEKWKQGVAGMLGKIDLEARGQADQEWEVWRAENAS